MSLRILPLVLVFVVLLTACSSGNNNRKANAYSATVHRTEGGFPHIVANDFGSLGFGTGYAAAQDNFCILALNVLRLRGQLAEFLGEGEGNIDSDIFRAYMVQTGMYDAAVSPEMEYLYAGFAAGFNHYLRQTGVDNISDPACAGADWVQPMTANDVRRAELTPAFLPRLAALFLAANPPEQVAVAQQSGPDTVTWQPVESDYAPAERLALAQALTDLATAKDKGSNGVAIGSDLTNHSGGMLYTNPHLDWDISFRFYPRHQIIPGVTNLLGANTYERTLMGFGTNGDVAWTNTVTASRNQAVYELELVPGNPMAYFFDGEEEAIEPVTVTIKVREEDGTLGDRSQTLYESRHGLIMGIVFGWGTENAFALRIANEGNRGQNGQAIESVRATSVRELKEVLNKYQASPSINVIAADAGGEALYGDLGPVANFTDQQLIDCRSQTPVFITFFAPAFHGNTSDCLWQTDADSAADGLLGASKQAFLIRRDYVTNSNDSYWLANPNAPITGIPMVQGEVGTERTLRTRSGLRMIQDRIDGTDGLGGNTFDLDSLIDRMLSNQNYTGQLFRDDLVTLCEANPSVPYDGENVDISGACPVLAAWDLRSDIDSRGAHLFREFMRAANSGTLERRTLPAGINYAVPFDSNDPVNTPRGLDTQDNGIALLSLAVAVKVLEDAGIALDARLGDLQSTTKNGVAIPLHGGEEGEGVFNKMSLDFAGTDAYPEVTGSSASWIMAVEFTEEGPRAKGVLAYSISADSTSPHFADMTELFSRKELVDLPYALEDVEAAALTTMDISEGSADCRDDGWQSFAEPAFEDEAGCRAYFRTLVANQLTEFVD
ncbi:MAG: hypothetical protein HKN19_15645 [Halioglobus sp.]|nr:hypothetical protein [Halioglobus sp.]